MTSDELCNLLTVSGVEARTRGDEVVVRVCFSCGNEKWNLELNADRGLTHCWACKHGGRLDALLHSITGSTHHIPVRRVEKRKTTAPITAPSFATQAIAVVESAQLYLSRRGITPKLAATYGMGVCVEKGHMLEGRIVIPAHEWWTDTVVGYFGRTYTNGRPKYLNTLSQQTITGWRPHKKHTAVVLVEGPLDGIAVHMAGFHPAVLGGTGSLGVVVEWAARIPSSIPIVLMLDPDAVLHAHQLYWRLRPLRSSLVMATLPPGQDPGSLGLAVREPIMQALRTISDTHTIQTREDT